MLEYYIFGSVFVPVAQLFTFVSYSLYLGYGLGNIPYGLLSCRSHSFIIFLQVMIPRLRAASFNDRPTDAIYRLTRPLH
jgi:hypothetical protein